jgi:hypothetical protein
LDYCCPKIQKREPKTFFEYFQILFKISHPALISDFLFNYLLLPEPMSQKNFKAPSLVVKYLLSALDGNIPQSYPFK